MVLAAGGLDIPFLRQLTGLVYLTLVPGLLIFRIIRLRNLGLTETLLYAAGVSIALVMFLGFFMNLAYPALGIPRPIGTLPLTVTFALLITVLSALAWFRERRESFIPADKRPFSWAEVLSPPALLLVLLPLISVLGTYLVNSRANNILLMVLLGLIALVVAFIGFNRFIPPRLYPLAVIMIAIALLWHWSLISGFLWGYDIHHEYYFQNQVLANGFWDSNLKSNVNSMLSVVILAPVYSIFLGMDSVWIFKIVYPLLFALLPLALFQVFRRYTDGSPAFLAVFLFMSFAGFFVDLIQVARQQIAELFFVLFLAVLLETAMADSKRRLLLVIFGTAIAVSHYGLAYFFLFYLVMSALILFLMRNRTLGRWWAGRRFRVAGSSPAVAAGGQGPEPPGAVSSTGSLTITMVYLMIVFYFAWYMYIGKGSPFTSLVNIGVNTFHGLREFFSIEAREAGVLMAVGLASPEVTSVPRQAFLILQYIIQFFIVAGVIGVVFRVKKSRFPPMFIAMTMVSGILLVLCIALPRFSINFNISRIYHITLLFLTPYCIIGGVAVLQGLYRRLTRRFSRPAAGTAFLSLLVVFILVPYFLFNTAFIYAVTGDTVTSIALNPDMDTPRYNRQEISGKAWLLTIMEGNRRVMADYYGVTWLVEPPFFQRLDVFYGDTETAPDNAYIYLRTLNTVRGLLKASEEHPGQYINLADSNFGREVLAHRSRIYDDGGAQVYDAGRGSHP